VDAHTRPDLTHSALITIDTQNDFTLENAPACIPGTRDVIANMCRLLELYRNQGLPIIHVIRLYLPDGSNAELCRRHMIEQGQPLVAPGTEGAELVRALKPAASVKLDAKTLLAGAFQVIGDNEYIMYKPRWGAFYATGLEAFLHHRGVNTLVFSGCNFPNCPRTSIYEASERDFRIVLVTDALSQLNAQGERDMRTIGVQLLDTQALAHQFSRVATSS